MSIYDKFGKYTDVYLLGNSYKRGKYDKFGKYKYTPILF